MTKWEEIKDVFNWGHIRKRGAGWFIRNVVNLIDDPFDQFKHWFHGLQICILNAKYRCTAYMKNRPGTRWSISRIDELDPDANNTIRIWCKK